MKQKSALILLALLLGYSGQAQNSYLNATSENSEKFYSGEKTYAVKTFPQKFKSQKPKNIIFLIGDGMGASQIFSGLTANHGHLFLENCKYMGFSKTQSADNYITDSAAGGTALSTGVKTYNGAIGVDINKKPVKTILEEAEEKGLATGLGFNFSYYTCNTSFIYCASTQPEYVRRNCCRFFKNRYRCFYWWRTRSFHKTKRW